MGTFAAVLASTLHRGRVQDTRRKKQRNPQERTTPSIRYFRYLGGKDRSNRRIIFYKGGKKMRLMLIGVVAVLVIFSSGCDTKEQGQAGDWPLENLQAQTVLTQGFANYEDIAVEVEAAVNDYQVAADLSNITNKEMFELSAAARELLHKNAFVVIPAEEKEFFMLYEMNRYRQVPLFVTVDSMLHNYHLFFNHLLRMVENDQFIPELKNLNRKMLSLAQKQYTLLKGTSWENAAKRNIGFFAVGSKLLDAEVEVPKVVKDEVTRELKLIEQHQGIAVSPLMNIGGSYDPPEALMEDYSQYIPRGHYERSSSLQSYFQTMMWYGRLTFSFKNEDEFKSAVLITLALNKDENYLSWDRIYTPTNFFVGKSDDICYLQFKELLADIYGNSIDLTTMVADHQAWQAFLEATIKLEPPAVNSIPIFDANIQPDREQDVKGFRFMGQRFTIDAAIFQRLIYREIKENSRGERRMLPRGLDIPAALGSQEAYALLKKMGETDYQGYQQNMERLREYIGGLKEQTWTQNLYWGWLYSLLPLLEEKPAGYPAFMGNQAWVRKELTTFLGSWTELKHDTILYAKQVYAECGGGAEGIDDRGYVEPNPYVYGRLAALIKMTQEGLKTRGLISEQDLTSLGRLEELARNLKSISEKELNNTPLSDAEYDLIRSYGAQLEHFWLEALRDEGIDHRSAIHDRPAALVADVATDPGGKALEVATGHIHQIYVAVPIDGQLRLAVGGVYSYYEFPWPLDDRLTDSKWHQMLDTGQVPPLPEWIGAYTANDIL